MNTLTGNKFYYNYYSDGLFKLLLKLLAVMAKAIFSDMLLLLASILTKA